MFTKHSREFTEEALDGKNWPHLEKLWQNGFELYRGYVDDPRNTDNAWMETVVMNFHDEQGIFDKVELKVNKYFILSSILKSLMLRLKLLCRWC